MAAVSSATGRWHGLGPWLLITLLLAAGAPAWATTGPIGPEDARHLLLRTGFAASPRDVAEYAKLTREQAVDRVLQRDHAQLGQDLKAWWLAEMIATSAPITERMTLFWHNHFVASLRKVRAPQLMYRYNATLRQHALGSFSELLHAMARDPAMIVYLDGVSNRKGQPNENFARELMELFTLGEGHYSERDVKEAARAFTGWSLDGESGQFVFRKAQHDDGQKTVLGRTDDLDGDDVLELLLEHPRTAENVVAKLWRELVSPDPDAGEVRRIARRLREARYDIRVAVRLLLASDAFWANENRATLVKSPVELIVGTLRQFGFRVPDAFPFVVFARQLGQDLLAPPNVKGWPGGEAWITASTLLARRQMLERLFRGIEVRAPMASMVATSQEPMRGMAGHDAQRVRIARAMAELRVDAERWLAQLERRDEASVARFLLVAPPAHPLASHAGAMETLHAVTRDPVYQLK